MTFAHDDLMLLAHHLQTKNRIQSFQLKRQGPETTEIQCQHCDAKVVFLLKFCEQLQQPRFKLSLSLSSLQHELALHDEYLK